MTSQRYKLFYTYQTLFCCFFQIIFKIQSMFLIYSMLDNDWKHYSICGVIYMYICVFYIYLLYIFFNHVYKYYL